MAPGSPPQKKRKILYKLLHLKTDPGSQDFGSGGNTLGVGRIEMGRGSPRVGEVSKSYKEFKKKIVRNGLIYHSIQKI